MARPPTIVDVATRAGVSKSLVSLVMRGSPRVSDASRKAVLRAAGELGYHPNAAARSLVQQRSGILGCVLSDLHNTYFADLADGIEEMASARGYRVMLSSGYLDAARESSAVDALLELRVDGLLLLGSMLPADEVDRFAERIPTVMVGRSATATGYDSVCDDDDAGAQLVVDHLVGLGHRRIAHLHAGAGPGAPARRVGYEAAMERHGLASHVHSVTAAFTEAGGRRAMREVLGADAPPTAVFAANDLAAVGALGVIDEAGLDVPGDISVAGYDDSDVSKIRRISLTTVAQPTSQIGATAARLLLERVGEDRMQARHVIFPPTLVVRTTTGPPRD